MVNLFLFLVVQVLLVVLQINQPLLDLGDFFHLARQYLILVVLYQVEVLVFHLLQLIFSLHDLVELELGPLLCRLVHILYNYFFQVLLSLKQRFHHILDVELVQCGLILSRQLVKISIVLFFDQLSLGILLDQLLILLLVLLLPHKQIHFFLLSPLQIQASFLLQKVSVLPLAPLLALELLSVIFDQLALPLKLVLFIFHILLKLRHLLLRVDVAQVLLDHFSILLELRDGFVKLLLLLQGLLSILPLLDQLILSFL